MKLKLTKCSSITAGVFALVALGAFVSSVSADESRQKSEAQISAGDAGELTDDEKDPLGIRSRPEEAEGIGVDSYVGEVLEMDIPFHNEINNFVKISDLFDGKRPVMLSFNYSNCPKLCSVQLENMTLALREVSSKGKLAVGKDFQVVSISIDPTEQTVRAREAKEKYLHLYNRSESSDGWHFLTGDRKNIRFMADQCGFRYKYVPEQKLYSHPPVFILLSPKGKIVRYIHGLDYDPNTIKLALVEAAEGKIGSPINILSYGLGCFSFNESTGKYTFQAMAIMRIGGALTAFVMVLGLVPYWFFRRGSKAGDDDSNSDGAEREIGEINTNDPLTGSAV
jgi:protein SCO1/2